MPLSDNYSARVPITADTISKEGEDELIVLADLPGVAEEDTRVNVERDLLMIEALSTGGRGQVHYYKEVMLPYEVRKDFDRSHKGVVLEVHLRPKRPAARDTRAKGKRGKSAKAGRSQRKKTPRRQESDTSKE